MNDEVATLSGGERYSIKIGRIVAVNNRATIMENGEKVADVNKKDMSTEDLEQIIRNGGRQTARTMRYRHAVGAR